MVSTDNLLDYQDWIINFTVNTDDSDKRCMLLLVRIINLLNVYQVY